jgi:hypothetical protein
LVDRDRRGNFTRFHDHLPRAIVAAPGFKVQLIDVADADRIDDARRRGDCRQGLEALGRAPTVLGFDLAPAEASHVVVILVRDRIFRGFPQRDTAPKQDLAPYLDAGREPLLDLELVAVVGERINGIGYGELPGRLASRPVLAELLPLSDLNDQLLPGLPALAVRWRGANRFVFSGTGGLDEQRPGSPATTRARWRSTRSCNCSRLNPNERPAQTTNASGWTYRSAGPRHRRRLGDEDGVTKRRPRRHVDRR